jgi:hypothetical protein
MRIGGLPTSAQTRHESLRYYSSVDAWLQGVVDLRSKDIGTIGVLPVFEVWDWLEE